MLPLPALQAFLSARIADRATRQTAGPITQLVVGLSAGPDSLALLLAAAHVAPSLGFSVRALHVHHGLQADADKWAEQALAQAAAAGVDIDVLRVSVVPSGTGIEAAARGARYDALAQALQPHEALLLGHHQDDQAETVLLRLMRGAGLRGLSAMHAISTWPGPPLMTCWRPWLGVSREAIACWLEDARANWLNQDRQLPVIASQALALNAIEDPANSDPRFARTTLRLEVLPRLQAQWPEAKALLARSAAQLACQQQVLDDFADDLLALIHDNTRPKMTLPCTPLSALSDASLQTLLSRWLQRCSAPSLPHRYWPRVRRELLQARADAAPCLAWAGWSLRRYRGDIYVLNEHELVQRNVPIELHWLDPMQPISWAGRSWCWQDFYSDQVVLCAQDMALPWRMARRQGGERWQPAGSAHHVTLKHWCQVQAIAPWQRDALSCLWVGSDIRALISAEGVIYKSSVASEGH